MISKIFVVLALIGGLIGMSSTSQAAWLVKQVRPANQAGKSAVVLDVQHLDREVSGIQVLRSFPRFLPEGAAPTGGVYEELLYSDELLPKKLLSFKKAPY